MKILQVITGKQLRVSANQSALTFTIHTEQGKFRSYPLEEAKFNSLLNNTPDEWRQFLRDTEHLTVGKGLTDRTPKTNRKDVYNQREAYILNAIDGEGYERELNTDQEKLAFLVATFLSEYGWALKRDKSHQQVFCDWMQGLPSSFNVAFENYRIIEIAKDWGSLAADADDKAEDKILDNWWNFIYMGVLRLMRKHKVEFNLSLSN